MDVRFLAMCLLGSLAVGCSGPSPSAETTQDASTEAVELNLTTSVLSKATAKSSDEEWGTFVEYFAGASAGTRDLLSGTATINPGLEIHPPHRHAEEEFLMVLEGEGEWTVGEETFEATQGDMLYSAAWDLHGIKNTGDEPLTFVFWKWNPQGLPTPVDPEL